MRIRSVLTVVVPAWALLASAGCESRPFGVRLLTPASATTQAVGTPSAATAASAGRYSAEPLRASVTENQPLVVTGHGLEYRLVGQSRLVVYIFNPGAAEVEIDAAKSAVTTADGTKRPVDLGGIIGPGRFIRLLLPPPIYETPRGTDPIARSQSAGGEYGMIRNNLDGSDAPSTSVKDAWPWPKGTSLTLSLTYQHAGAKVTDQLELTR